MRLQESLRSGFRSLLHNKIRSILTMLGIIIGIFSVIMVTSIGAGIKGQVTAQIESLGANLVYVFPGKVEIVPGRGKSKLGVQENGFGQNVNTLTYNDVLTLKGKKDISAVSCIAKGIDRLDDLKIYTTTTGVDEEYLKFTKLDIRYGRFFTKRERVNRERVAFIGDQANKELFEGADSVGRNIRLNGKAYKVVGVMKYIKPENLGYQGEDLNVRIYLPVTEMIDRTGQTNIIQIMVSAASAEKVTRVEKTVRAALLKYHREGEFSVIKQQDMINTTKRTMSILTAGFGGIAGISLLVGGIGIMNIMLVTVSERIREIGVRKAVGAARRDILIQFLIEAVVLSIVGGLLGLLAGIAGAMALPRFWPTVHTTLSLGGAAITLLFALVVGVFFGVYPAAKAARLDPIEALRAE